ncbi:MAG: GAF domain-containing protein, partial [Myxococcales bacterium]|nr:GAF domain-containing protein [Myxococcales bacterium]
MRTENSSVVDYTEELAQLARLAAEPEAIDALLARALASLRQVLPYDLAAIYQLRDGVLEIRTADGPLADERVRRHRLSLRDFPTLQRALETRRPIALEAHHHAGEEGDPYDGVLDLPHGHACMVVPLFAGDRTLGLMTFDRTV